MHSLITRSVGLVSLLNHTYPMSMDTPEMRYRVTCELRSVYQLVVQATSPEEAEVFADDIDLDKWQYIESEYQVIDVAKDYFLKKVKDRE
jgi:hypothetical protein